MITLGKHVNIALLPLALAACDAGSSNPTQGDDSSVPPAPSPSAHKIVDLESLIQAGLLGDQVAYVESLIGPAKTVDGVDRSYNLKGCDFHIYHTKSKKIYAFKIYVDDKKCVIDYTQFGLPKIINGMTFGQISELLGQDSISYGIDCLMCGNSFDPSDYMYYSGPHVSNYIQFEFSGDAMDDTWDSARSVDGYNNYHFENGEVLHLTEDVGSYAPIKCNPIFDRAAPIYTRDVKISTITIGYYPLGNRCHKR